MQLIRPTWADPRWVVSANSFALVKVNFTPGQIIQLLPNDPTRWAIIFNIGNGGASNTTIGPSNSPLQDGFVLSNAGAMLRFTLFDSGPMVCAEWYLLSIGSGVCNCWISQVQ